MVQADAKSLIYPRPICIAKMHAFHSTGVTCFELIICIA